MVRWEELTPTRRVAQKTQLARTYVTGSDAPQVATYVEVGSPSTHAQTAAETLPNSDQLQVLAQSSPTERTNPNTRQISQHSPTLPTLARTPFPATSALSRPAQFFTAWPLAESSEPMPATQQIHSSEHLYRTGQITRALSDGY
uniref:(northern house mosquito) hypothetical protein n=1 Tax=Culex pipiens TaxID=7175 RepID=A0A8D8BIA2_CULPI